MKQPNYEMPYEVRCGCLFKWVASGKTSKDILLCNFLPYLIAEKIYDNGLEQERFFEVGAIHESGVVLPPLTLSVAEFESMNWITEKWGSRCNTEAGRNIKEHIRHAIQTTAKNVVPQIIYSHSGFREIDGKLKYLLNGMEIGCECRDATLKNYGFPSVTDENNISASVELLKSALAPKKIMYPMLAFQYLAPLCHLMNMAGYMPKTVLALVGRTGSKKSTLSALMLSHFGNFTHDTLPLTFRDTGNSIVARLFASKDLPTVIDDFHPTNGGYEESSMLKTFQLIMRAFGDGTGRASLNQKRELKEANPPRGIGMITAEYSPNISESGLARCLEISISPNDIVMEVLSCWQQLAKEGALATSMKEYILWLEMQLDDEEKIQMFLKSLEQQFENLRENLRKELKSKNIKFHDRTPEACAYLLTGFYYFCDFCMAKDLILESENIEMRKDIYEIMIEVAEKQSKLIESISASEHFILTVVNMISAEMVLVPSKENYIDLQNDSVGYQDDDFYYLNMTRTLKAVRKFCLEQGEMLPLKHLQLLNQLDEDGFVIPSKQGKPTQTVRVSTVKTVRVAVISKEKVQKVCDECAYM